MARCKQHSFVKSAIGNDENHCAECGNNISGFEKLCKRCSKFLNQCQICGVEANSRINPMLIAAYKSPEAVAARKLHLIAVKVLEESYGSALANIHESLTGAFMNELSEQTVKLGLKLETDVSTDPVCILLRKKVEELQGRKKANKRSIIDAEHALDSAMQAHVRSFEAARQNLLNESRKKRAPYDRMHQTIWQKFKDTQSAMTEEANKILDEVLAEARAQKTLGTFTL